MFWKIRYYLKNLRNSFMKFFSLDRLKKYGISIALLDFISFLCHRSSSKFQLLVIRTKDKLVQKYLYKNYSDTIARYRKNDYEKC